MPGEFSGTRTVNTYAFLYEGALRAVEKAEKTEEGRFYDVLNALILSAFTVEAYLNHLMDSEAVASSASVDERLSVWRKYRLVSRILKVGKGDLNEAFPEIASVLVFRNFIAHGKTQLNRFSCNTDEDFPPRLEDFGESEWQQFAVLENAQTIVNSVRIFASELSEAAGLGSYPFSVFEMGSYSFVLKEVEVR
ncbi:hypothetical protein [Pseudomonas syringae]|uniref:hypothetical protein n=1 Tax=Pseudomonas syringae TaxID=317 RepID=UPI001F0E5CCD|nr:hypothetical protein [Pseudomonas syringae]MCH5518976.1 hypothetical protein [Pseudomonas syringae pv. lapsa]